MSDLAEKIKSGLNIVDFIGKYVELKKRGTESEEEIERRMETAKLEIQYANEYDYRVINDQAERAAAEIIQIVESVEGRDCNEKKR